MTTNTTILAQSARPFYNPVPEGHQTGAILPLNAAEFQRMEEIINPQGANEQYVCQGKRKCHRVRFEFSIPEFLRLLAQNLGAPQIESLSATGGAANYIVYGGSKNLRDLDLTVVMRGPQNAISIKQTVLKVLEEMCDFRKSIEGGQVIFKDRYGNEIAKIPHSGDNDYLFAHGGLDALGAYQDSKMVILTFPCTINGVKRNIDLTILWDPETSCRSSADSLRCELKYYVTGNRDDSSVFGADSYAPSESIELMENGLFTIRPIPRAYRIREGLFGYAHLLTNGLVPNKPDIEELFLIQCSHEYKKEKHRFNSELQKFLERHYHDDEKGAILYLANFYAVAESARREVLQSDVKRVILQQIGAHIAKRRGIAPEAVRKELALIFWENADTLSRRLDDLPGSHPTRYRFGRFAPNEPRTGALLPIPWKDTVEWLLDQDPAMAEKQKKIRAKVSASESSPSPAGRLIQLLCREKIDLSAFIKHFIDSAARLSEEEITTAQKLLHRYHPQVPIDLTRVFESLASLEDSIGMKSRKIAYTHAIKEGKDLDRIVASAEKCPWEEARGYLLGILDHPSCPPEIALVCQMECLKRGSEDDIRALGPRIQSETAKQLWMDAIGKNPALPRAKALMDAPFLQGPAGVPYARRVLEQFAENGNPAAFLQLFHIAREKGILPPGEEILPLLEKFDSYPMEPDMRRSYGEALSCFSPSDLPVFDLATKKGAEWSRAQFAKSFADACLGLSKNQRQRLFVLLEEHHPECRIPLEAQSPIDFLAMLAGQKGWQDAAAQLAFHLAKTVAQEDLPKIPAALKSEFANLADQFYLAVTDRQDISQETREALEIQILDLPFRDHRIERIFQTPRSMPSEAWIRAVDKHLLSAPPEAAARLLAASPSTLSMHRETVCKLLDKTKGSPKEYFALLEAAIRQRAIYPAKAWEYLTAFKSKQPPLQQFFQILFALRENDPSFCDSKGLEFFSPVKHPSLMKSKERIADCWRLFSAFAKAPAPEGVSELEICAVEFLLQGEGKGGEAIDKLLEALLREEPTKRISFLECWEKISATFEERPAPSFQAAKQESEKSAFNKAAIRDAAAFPSWSRSLRKQFMAQLKAGREADAALEMLLQEDALSYNELFEIEKLLPKGPLYERVVHAILSDPDISPEQVQRICKQNAELVLAHAELVARHAPFTGLELAVKAIGERKGGEWKEFAEKLVNGLPAFPIDKLELFKNAVRLGLLSADELWAKCNAKPTQKLTQVLPFCMETGGFDAAGFIGDLLSQKIDVKMLGEVLAFLDKSPDLQPRFAKTILDRIGSLKTPAHLVRFRTYFEMLSEREQNEALPLVIQIFKAGVANKLPQKEMDHVLGIIIQSRMVISQPRDEFLSLLKSLIAAKDPFYLTAFEVLFNRYFGSDAEAQEKGTLLVELIDFIHRENIPSVSTFLLTLLHQVNQHMDSIPWEALCKASTELFTLMNKWKPYRVSGTLNVQYGAVIANQLLSMLIPRANRENSHLPPKLLQLFFAISNDYENSPELCQFKAEVVNEMLKHPELSEKIWVEMPQMTLTLNPKILLSYMDLGSVTFGL